MKKSRKEALAKARDSKEAKRLAQLAEASPLTPSTPAAVFGSAASENGNGIPVKLSASKRKLDLTADFAPQPCDTSQRLLLVDISCLAALFEPFRCKSCGGSLTIVSDTRKGFVCQLKTVCFRCGDMLSKTMTSKTLKDSAHYDINRRAVMSFLNVGLGFAGLRTFCETMGLEGLTEKSHARHVRDIHKASERMKSTVLDKAVSKVKVAYGKAEDDTVNITISYDGTWQKRGHTSKHGLGVVIDVATGLAVDYHIMSSFCQPCSTQGVKKRKEGEAAYNIWWDQHKSCCTVNHTGSAGMMEVEVAKVMFTRSLDRGLRYTTLVADGDCKTFNELQTLRPYGDVDICKEECTNHVSKRLGTGLRNLVSAESKKGNTLAGRKEGSLTHAKIALLQAHYKKAVASKSATVDELSKKIWTTFHHASSTDENSRHQHCPTGVKSWCFYNRALAFGKDPPSHKGRSSSYISSHVAEKVKSIYERLTAPDLLQRCLKGLTQNANEATHSTIWSRCPKHLFAGRRRAEIATTIAVGSFNSGSTSLREFSKECGLGVGTITIAHGVKRDLARIRRAEKAEKVEAKRRRVEMARAVTIAQQKYLVEFFKTCDNGESFFFY